MSTTEQQIRQIMANVLGLPLDQINESSSPDTIESWDSIKHLNLVVALEEEFQIEIPSDEVGNLLSTKLIGLVVEECLA